MTMNLGWLAKHYCEEFQAHNVARSLGTTVDNLRGFFLI
jgi:hypothetical protein